MPDIFTILWILVLAHIFITWFLSIRRGLQARRRSQDTNPVKAPSLPPVSIIVPAWKEKGTVDLCIGALKRVEYPDWEALILAGGPDGTYEAALQAAGDDSRFRVLERGPEPKNVAIMQGVKVARHEILVLLDADSLVEPDWLCWLMKPMASGAAASFGMHYPSRETWISMYEHMDHTRTYQIQGSANAAGCASQAIRKDVLDRIGPLPVNAYSWEDWDIDVRLMQAGETNVIVPNARLLTERPTTLSQFWQNLVRCQRSHLAGLWFHRYVAWSHPQWGFNEILFYLVSFGVVLSALAGLALAILRPDWQATILQIGALAAVWIGGRSAALGAEVAAYKSDYSWLRRSWLPIALLPVQFAASVVAALGFWKQPRLDYKGARMRGDV